MRNLALFLFISCVSICSSCIAQAKTMTTTDRDYIIEDYIKKWKANKRYLLKILEAMPASEYDFKPAEGMKTFKSQSTHIASWLNSHIKNVGHNGLTPLNTSSKEFIIQSYTTLFDEIIDFVSKLSPNELNQPVKMWYGQSTKSRLMNLMDNHMTHHRGQMIVYLRLKNIKPPSYIGW